MATSSAGIPTPPYQVTQSQAHVATDTARRHQEPGVIKPNELPQSYPYAPFPHDGRDEDERIKGSLIDWNIGSDPTQQGINGAVPMYQLQQSDIEYIKDKQAFLENAQFELWAYNQFDHTDPANARIFNELFPEFYKRQRDYIDYCAEVMKRWAYINATGVQTRDDVMFKWLLQSGQIHVPQNLTPNGMLENLEEARGGVKQPLATEERGIFNPMRYLGVDRDLPQGGYDPDNRAYAFPTYKKAWEGIGVLNPGTDGAKGGKSDAYRAQLNTLMYGNKLAKGAMSGGFPGVAPSGEPKGAAAGPGALSSWLGGRMRGLQGANFA